MADEGHCWPSHALSRWLKRVHGGRFDFLRSFGGVYYLFVRGLNGQDESTGVFFHQPTAADIDLVRTMRGPGGAPIAGAGR